MNLHFVLSYCLHLQDLQHYFNQHSQYVPVFLMASPQSPHRRTLSSFLATPRYQSRRAFLQFQSRGRCLSREQGQPLSSMFLSSISKCQYQLLFKYVSLHYHLPLHRLFIHQIPKTDQLHSLNPPLNYIWISYMNRSSVSQPKSKGKSLSKAPSAGLIDFLNKNYGGKIPVAAITASSKYFGKNRIIKKQDRTIKRLSSNSNQIPLSSLQEFLNIQKYEKGKPLSQDAVNRIFQSFANQGKLSFEYVLKLAESTGVTITEKMAKLIVRKYGKRKDHLNVQDCVQTVARKGSAGKSTSKSPKK